MKNYDDPFLDERILQLINSRDTAVSVQRLIDESAENAALVTTSVRNLIRDGLVEERNGGFSVIATPEGRRRARAAIAASLDAEMQEGIQVDRDAIVAAATHIMDVANADKMLAIVGRSSVPLSRQALATTIGEDVETVDELAAELVADGLLERTSTGAFTATDKGRRHSADITDAEMQDLFSSERDAIVASAGALMSVDIADVLYFEAAEEDRQRTGLVASLTYDEVDPWAPAPRTRHQCAPDQVALSRATEAARQATAQFARTRSRADGDRALAATRQVRALLDAAKAKKR